VTNPKALPDAAWPVFISEKEKSRSSCGFSPENGELVRLLVSGVLVFVDLPAGFVLFLVEPFLLALGQVTIVGGHISFLLVLGSLLAVLQMSSLPRRQSAVLLAIGNTVLLILFAAIYFVDAGMIRINHSRARAGCVVLGLSRGGADKHETTHCQD
jgi:uncharacterized membrane protein